MIDQLVLGALGSCRVHSPLTHMAKAERVRFKTDSVIGYLHNPLEIIQAVRLLRGELHAPPDLAKLINVGAPEVLGAEDRFRKLFENVDVLVLEISSVRIVEFQGWQLQLNRVQEYLGLSSKQFSGLFKGGDREEAVAALPPTASQLAVHLLRSGRFYEIGGVPLVAALSELRRLVDMPVAFVGVVTEDYDGVAIPQRVSLAAALEWIAKQPAESRFIDPMKLVRAQGLHHWMADLGHYKKEHEEAVGRFIRAELQAFADTSPVVRGRIARRQLREAKRAEAAQQRQDA